MDKKLVEQIKDTLEVVGPDGEYAKTINRTPLEKYLSKMVNQSKFPNRESYFRMVRKICTQADKGDIESYCTETFKNLNDDAKENFFDLALRLVDYGYSNTAYARMLFKTEKISGLMRISGESMENLKDDGVTFSEGTTWSKMGAKMVDFPQFIRFVYEVVLAKDGITDEFDTSKITGILEDLDDIRSKDSRDAILDLIAMADFGFEILTMFKELSSISKEFTTLKEETAFDTADKTDDEEVEDIIENLKFSVRNYAKDTLKLSKSDTTDFTNDVLDVIEGTRNLSPIHMSNIRYLFAGSPMALTATSSEPMTNIIQIICNWAPWKKEEDNRDFTMALLPLLYIVDVCDLDKISDITDFDLLSEIEGYDEKLHHKRDIYDVYKDEDELEIIDVEDMDPEISLSIDKLLGVNVCTYWFGVYDKQSLISMFASRLQRQLSYEYLKEKIDKTYNKEISPKTIEELLSTEFPTYKEFKAELTVLAKAIYQVYKD